MGTDPLSSRGFRTSLRVAPPGYQHPQRGVVAQRVIPSPPSQEQWRVTGRVQPVPGGYSNPRPTHLGGAISEEERERRLWDLKEQEHEDPMTGWFMEGGEGPEEDLRFLEALAIAEGRHKEATPGPLASVPGELVSHISSYLGLSDVTSLGSTSAHMRTDTQRARRISALARFSSFMRNVFHGTVMASLVRDLDMIRASTPSSRPSPKHAKALLKTQEKIELAREAFEGRELVRALRTYEEILGRAQEGMHEQAMLLFMRLLWEVLDSLCDLRWTSFDQVLLSRRDEDGSFEIRVASMGPGGLWASISFSSDVPHERDRRRLLVSLSGYVRPTCALDIVSLRLMKDKYITRPMDISRCLCKAMGIVWELQDRMPRG